MPVDRTRGNTAGTSREDSGYKKVTDHLRGRKVYIETYGCRYNAGDSDKLAEIVKHLGGSIEHSPDEAEVIVINTCTVIGATERRMLKRLSHFRDRDLIVTGCMPEVQAELINTVCSPVFIRSACIQDIYKAIKPDPCNKGIAIVELARGCPGQCTYCLTRQARGPLESFPAYEIIPEVITRIRAGAVEIQFTAQDISSWGSDRGTSLPALLKAVHSLPGRFRLRVGMMNPATIRTILDELVGAFAGDQIFKFIHIPVQSGSDAILDRMGRGYSVTDFKKIVTRFRKDYPKITLATDIIVGFPGESEDDYSGSLSLIEDIRPNKVNITRYSRRPFTPMFHEKEHSDGEKKNRSRAMQALAERIYSSVNHDYLENRVPFIVTEVIKEGSVLARSDNYLGIVLKENLPLGYIGEAILKSDRKYFFEGERVRGSDRGPGTSSERQIQLRESLVQRIIQRC